MKTTLHSVGDGVISVNRSNIINFINREAESIIGINNKEASGKDLFDIFKIVDQFQNRIFDLAFDSEKKHIEERFLLKEDGKKIPIDYNISNTLSEIGNVNGFVIAFRDYTDKKEKQDRILYLSYNDQLTGLNNRRFFEEKILEIDREENLPLTIAMIDVNGLKLTNDAFGHSMGDKLLKSVAETLKENCPKEGLISRIGGDEFVLLLPKTVKKSSEEIVKKIYASFKDKTIDNIIISVSIGCCTKTRKEEKISDIFSKAEDNMYKKKLTESQSMRNRTIKVILKKLSEKSLMEKLHSERVSAISRKIGELMGLDDETLNEIETVGLLHDIGKISIDQTIFDLPRKLTKEEYNEVKRHPECGYYILKSVDNYSYLAEYILSHHERFDGKGYPRKKKGNEIPLISRIIAVADAYESMSADRPYRKALPQEKIIEEFKANSPSHFDPYIVELFLENIFEF